MSAVAPPMMHERDEKRVLAADQIADAAEEQRAERPHDEADGKRREIRDERERVVAAGIEQRRDDRGQAAEDVEVVPLDHRADRRRGDDLPDAVVGGRRRHTATSRDVHASS